MSHNVSSKEPKKEKPYFQIFPVVIVLIFGILMGIYSTVFSKKDSSLAYKEAVNLAVYTPKFDIIIPQRTAEAIAEGEKLYREVCQACHGDKLQGVVGPTLVGNNWRNPPGKETHLFKLVWNGIPNGKPAMPAKGGRSDLTSEQIWKILYFVSSKNPNIEKDSVPNQ